MGNPLLPALWALAGDLLKKIPPSERGVEKEMMGGGRTSTFAADKFSLFLISKHVGLVFVHLNS